MDSALLMLAGNAPSLLEVLIGDAIAQTAAIGQYDRHAQLLLP